MYAEIDANKRKTVLLIFLFSLIIIAIGWAFGYQTGATESGIILAAVIASGMSLIGYFHGDKVALAAAGAKKIVKHDAPELYRLVENLAITSGLPTPTIYLINDPSPNAFAAGRDPAHASIAVTAGLLTMLEKPELEGVIAHELSHIKNYDIRVMTIVVVLVGIIMLLSDWLMRSTFFRKNSNRDDNQATAVFLLIGIVLAIISPLLAELINLAVSRSREYLADASGALLTRYPDGLACALQKIADYDRPMRQANHATAHMFIANPFDPKVTKKFEHFFSTHPPIEERIAKLNKMTV